MTSDETSPSLLLATLRTLNTIADSVALAHPNSSTPDKELSKSLFSKSNAKSLAMIIDQTSQSTIVQQSVLLATRLISKVPMKEQEKETLADAGVLKALVTKAACFIVAQGFVFPWADIYTSEADGLLFSPPATQLGPVLQAIGVIVDDSRSRAEALLASPTLTTVFPKPPLEFAPDDVKKGPTGSYLSGFAVPRRPSNPMSFTLPYVPTLPPKSNHNTNFPPLGNNHNVKTYENSWTSESAVLGVDDDESGVIPWLFHIVRADSGLRRLNAAWLLTLLYRFGLANKSRVTMFAHLVIPPLVRILDKDFELLGEPRYAKDEVSPATLEAKEMAASIIALLCTDTPELQNAAVDAGAIPRLTHLLKESHQVSMTAARPSLWSPHADRANAEGGDGQVSQLGEPGLTNNVRLQMNVREGALKALASISPIRDDFRKAIVDTGVVPLIVDSLRPFENDTKEEESKPSDASKSKSKGNPISVLIAACGAVRALTRSVSVLRTSLIDNGVAAPLFGLLTHPEIEVQIAATAATCNLALDLSPMRQVSDLLMYCIHV